MATLERLTPGEVLCNELGADPTDRRDVYSVSVISLLNTLQQMCDFPQPLPAGWYSNLPHWFEGFDGSAKTWAVAMLDKASDAIFPSVVEVILSEGFNVPINVSIREGEIGPEIELMNGHHRLVAALLLGLDDVLVTTRRQLSHDSSRPLDVIEGYADEQVFYGDAVQALLSDLERDM